MTLSKSQFVKGVKCPKLLWHLKKGDIPRAEPDTALEALFEEGIDVGKLARELFPGGREIGFDSDDFEGMIRQTREWIDAGVPIIYEAAAQANGGFAMADILRRGKGGWELYEVKATGSVKDYHLYDAGFQFRVFRDFGLDIGKVAIIHIDTSYVRHEDLKIDRLFTIEDITSQVTEMQNEIEQTYRRLVEMLHGGEPAMDIGPHCDRFFECEYAEVCWGHLPNRSVFDLYRHPWNERFNLYYRGVLKIGDLPEGFTSNFIQSLQIEVERTGRPISDRKKVRAFLAGLRYPLNFLDFETFMEAVPWFDDQHPFQQMPFQYSLHILHEDGRLEHREFLADEQNDPRRPLIIHMLHDLTPSGSLIAYNAAFEKRVIEALAEYDPVHRDQLLTLLDRFEDLLAVFRSGGYYHPDFNGSFSLKSVLPALFPGDAELNYGNQAIQNGGMAMDTYARLHRLKDPAMRERIRADLLAYCRLDTLAMVKIHEFLKKLAA